MPKLAILTSGGDSPGMNMAIWQANAAMQEQGWQVVGIREGFAGLLRGDFLKLEARETMRYTRYGGTFLASSRDPDFALKIPDALLQLEQAEITHLLVLGGNGSIRGAAALASAGIKVVGIPATIDNDVAGSEDSIGFDTACNFGLQMIDQFRDTLEALPRLCVLETLGGDTGFLALEIGRAGGADCVLLPEHPISSLELLKITRAAINHHKYALIVASEGYPDLEQTILELEAALGLRLRFSRPSHAMRGGRPSSHDRSLAAALALEACGALTRGESGMMGWQNGKPKRVNFKDIPNRKILKPENQKQNLETPINNPNS
jgi:6-phosphofructokinase 1